jgi:predicted transcriptional regulator
MNEAQAVSLTDVEWRLMQSLWRLSAPTLRQVVDDVADIGWTNHAVICFLGRMADKGYVAIEGTRPKRYRPLLEQSAAFREKTHDLLSKVYGGDLMLMVTNAVQSAALSDEEMNELIEALRKGR